MEKIFFNIILFNFLGPCLAFELFLSRTDFLRKILNKFLSNMIGCMEVENTQIRMITSSDIFGSFLFEYREECKLKKNNESEQV